MDNVQNAVNPLCGISMHNIQSTTNLSRYCIQFTPVKAHNNTNSLYPLDISANSPVAFLIASKYYVHVWPDVQPLYIVMGVPESYSTNLNITPVTRSSEEGLETTLRVSPNLLIDQYSRTNDIIEAQRSQSITRSINH